MSGSSSSPDYAEGLWRGAVGGWLATVPFGVAAVGWTAHWNAYVNLMFTLGGVVLLATVVAAIRHAKAQRG